MAWYWEDIDNMQRAKTAAVNPVRVTALLATWQLLGALQGLLLQPSRRTGRLWVSLAVAVTFAAIGWGIHRMSHPVPIVLPDGDNPARSRRLPQTFPALIFDAS